MFLMWLHCTRMHWFDMCIGEILILVSTTYAFKRELRTAFHCVANRFHRLVALTVGCPPVHTPQCCRARSASWTIYAEPAFSYHAVRGLRNDDAHGPQSSNFD
ncbi:hypothetical protein DAEQUDRAFT_57156 [Daedalea quercina L-15889]|uniref:Uncharacterized protein n=1 Tax=Daedalea quercina L-15889 TaxID=1314783 RepID=A0A165SJX1_9APHY|nr:hypothetical protein DAEQUDRAFT_57156 [Daedalea quercina L-15889]